MNRHDSILEGSKKAARLHEILGTKDCVVRAGGRIDVFDATLQQGASLLFRKLEGILGAYMNEEGTPGIIVTTQRPLSVQRFTAAHELGHYYMGHEPCFDGEEILGSSEAFSSVEVQANAFAAEFLAPKWLLFQLGKRHSWNGDSVKDPITVYQMSLRLGLSYEATCHSLCTHKILAPGVVQSLLATTPKEIKRQILPASFTPKNWYSDVWLLTETDRDSQIEGQAEDFFVLQFKEQAGAGYLWDTTSLAKQGFTILSDERRNLTEGSGVGGPVLHKITTEGAPLPAGSINLAQNRPWEKATQSLEQITINYDITGKENGLPRARRRQLHAA
jgi:Zn-dependent peptidase ImmA (M78 family)/predicted secreted protein